MPNPFTEKKKAKFTTMTMDTYQDQLRAGFSIACEICQICSIDSLKYVQEFTQQSVIVGTFPCP